MGLVFVKWNFDTFFFFSVSIVSLALIIIIKKKKKKKKKINIESYESFATTTISINKK